MPDDAQTLIDSAWRERHHELFALLEMLASWGLWAMEQDGPKARRSWENFTALTTIVAMQHTANTPGRQKVVARLLKAATEKPSDIYETFMRAYAKHLQRK